MCHASSGKSFSTSSETCLRSRFSRSFDIVLLAGIAGRRLPLKTQGHRHESSSAQYLRSCRPCPHLRRERMGGNFSRRFVCWARGDLRATAAPGLLLRASACSDLLRARACGGCDARRGAAAAYGRSGGARADLCRDAGRARDLCAAGLSPACRHRSIGALDFECQWAVALRLCQVLWWRLVPLSRSCAASICILHLVD